MEEAEDVLVRRRRPIGRWIALGLALLLLIPLMVIWTQRRNIATDYIDRELARRGVQATYDVKRIGFRRQRLENLVIGDPKRPDLTARWVQIEVSIGIRKPRVSLITAHGVRLYGRLEGGRVRLGQVDKLLPPPSGRPFRLPNQRIDVKDVEIALATPAGPVGIALEGTGNLAFSFEGRVAAASPGLRLSEDCRLDAPRMAGAITTEDEQPSFRGPVEARRIVCAGLDLSRPRLTLDTTLRAGLDGGRGNADVAVAELRSGDEAFGGVRGRVGFDGDANRVRGGMRLSAIGAAVGGYRMTRVSLAGRYAVEPKTDRVAVIADLGAGGVTGGERTLAAIEGVLGSFAGTPVEPVARSLAASVRRMSGAFEADAAIRVVNGRGFGAARVERLNARSRSGARVALREGTGVTYYWPSGSARVDTEVALAGGGFPGTRLSLRQSRPGTPIRGIARIAPMAANGASLRLTEVRFTAGDRGTTRVETVAEVDGPFLGGRVEDLLMPVSGGFAGGGFAFGERCTPMRFRSLRTGALRLGPTQLPLCPTGRALVWKQPGQRVQGGAEIRNARFAGALGESPLSYAADRLLFNLGASTFTSTGTAIRLGREGSINRLNFATLAGTFGRSGVTGTFAGGDGKLAAVPLLISEAAGRWSFIGSNLDMGGSLRVSDEMDPSRFYPLISNDFRLSLRNNRIDAGGWLIDPETGTRVTQAQIDHNLETGQGLATLDVPGIRFDENYQPEELTRLTLGVVALVRGVLKGQGEIRWSPEGSSSTGTFSTEDMDLAAAFGPVEGLSTTIRFTDLLGLQTAPGQVANVDLIRTGIDVLDGRIRYQLLPEMKVKVEAGRWPFAGGELILEETILDFSQPSMKRLVFRVVGMDAARFVSQMEFSNISATGTFDGIIPMEFDERGGRIVGGRLMAREGGGTLSYVGELTDKQLGIYGKLAFDALKSLRYSKLIINLDGSLDGEFVAGIELDGIARDPALGRIGTGGGISGIVARRALTELAKIPFEFNINIRGPFRALIATARSFEDPSNLIQSVLPPEFREQSPLTSVQPKESEKVR